MAQRSDQSVRLTGGTFFALLTRAMKTPTRKSATKKKSFGEDAGGITEPELMKGLIRVCGVKNPVFPAKGSKLTEYKQCLISANVYMPFDEDQFEETFDLSVKGNYQKPLSEMAKVVDTFIDFENDSKRDRLVRSLLEVLKQDKTIDDKTELYAKPDGSKISVEKLDSESVFYIESVLLGIWHYIITNVKDNTVGQKTYDSWYSRDGEKRATHTFVGTIGGNTERSIKVLRAKNVKTPIPEKEFEEFTKDLETYDEYLRALKERYDSIKTLLYKDCTFPFYDLYVCNDVGVKKVETLDGETKVTEGIIEDFDVTVFDEFARHIVITGIGSSGVHLAITMIQKRNETGVEFYIVDDKELFKQLLSKKDTIEKDAGLAFDWQELPERKGSRVIVTRAANFDDKDEWPAQFDWIMDSLLRIKKAFKKHI